MPKQQTSPEIKRDWSPSRGVTWKIDVTINGTRVRRKGFATVDEAEAALADLEPNPDIQLGAAFVHGTLKIGAIGAVSELLVCTDLLKQGFDVFRSVSSNAACDLIAANNDGRLCRVEVKSAVTRKGVTRFKRHRLDSSKHDVLALVFLREHRIEYSVSVREWFDQSGKMSETEN